MTVRRAACLVLVLVGGAIAGCGGGDDESSAEKAQAKYEQLGKELSAFSDQLGTTIRGASGKSDAELQSELEGLVDQVGSQVDELEDLDVPQDVTTSKDELVAALKVGVGDIREIAAAAGQHDAEAAVDAVRQLVADSNEIKQAQSELKAALEKAVGN